MTASDMTSVFTNTGTGSETGKNKITERVARKRERERETDRRVCISRTERQQKPVYFTQTLGGLL